MNINDIKLSSNQTIYVVICQMRDETWRISSFWELPYSSVNYRQAVEYKRKIADKATRSFSKYWKQMHFKVLKIELKNE